MNDSADDDPVDNSRRIEFRSVSGRHLLIRQENPLSVRECAAHATLSGRAETAAARFGGMGCAQALATAYADLVGMTESDAANLAFPFGLGMGRQLTCSAVTVMLMLAGLSGNGEKAPDLFERFERETGSSACDYFLEKHEGHGHCRELLRCAGKLVNRHIFASHIECITREEPR